MSAEAIGWIIAAVILIGVIVFLFKGMIQTFRRNWVLALILLAILAMKSSKISAVRHANSITPI